MTHTIHATTLAAAEADQTLPVYLVELAFASGTVYFHSGLGPLVWNGNTYTGAGSLGVISGIEETGEATRSSFTVGLSGVSSSIISISLNEYYQGRPAVVREGRLDPTTRQLVADPWVMRRGFMDTFEFVEDDKSDLTLHIESEFSQWDKPVVRRYTDADQQSRYPGDAFFEFVEQMADKTIYWGREPQ